MQSIRERLKKERRKRRWRLLRIFICLLILLTSSVHIWRYIHRTDVAFGHIVVEGSNILTHDDVALMSGSGLPFNIFNASMGLLKDSLQHDIRVRDAEVSYQFPLTIKVTIKERTPAIYVANSYKSYLQVDYSGLVIKVVTSIPDASAPVLIGAECGNVFLGDKIDNKDVLGVLYFLQNISTEARNRIAEIVVDDRKYVKLSLRNSLPIILGSVEGLNEKVALFNSVFSEINNKHIQAEYIDLTFAKPYIKLLPGKK